MRKLPEWLCDESARNEFIDALAETFKGELLNVRAVYRSERAAEFGRAAEIICDLASIKADAPLLLAR